MKHKKAKEQAYEMGKEKGYPSGKQFASQNGKVNNSELVDALTVSFEGLTQSADYANNTLPDLRRMAGYKDRIGAGTYTRFDTEEQYHNYLELVDRFEEGYSDGFRKGYGTQLEKESE